MIILISIIFISISLISIIILSPLRLGITILLIAITTSLLFSFINSSWIAFLIFLIYIRGTLIIFSYFVAITPNINISFPTQIPIILITIPTIRLIIISIPIHLIHSNYSQTLNTFYTPISIPVLIIIIILLLITIVIVVKISSITKGPLRPFNSNYV